MGDHSQDDQSQNYRDILLEIDGPIATIRFNRPKSFNAMTVGMLAETRDALDRVALIDSVRVVLITGTGRAFSAGADLAATLAALPVDADGKPDLGHLLEAYYNPLVSRMRSLPQPVIAVVNGVAAGGASSLAFAADLTLAARSASFVQAFVNVALIPDVGGSWSLPRALGRQRAMGHALLGSSLSAQQAQEMGLIWAVADDDKLAEEALALASKLAAGPRTSIRAIKHAINAAAEQPFDHQLALEQRLQAECGRSPDFVEAARAFVEKRKPSFK
ncbi:enoyl-CoA hydratase-related protein [Hydrocarboniphaga effusa]|uniref:enoyl-CoA hydratase-related protein n=1 Tax=Hydrocarboniphaga effusa TaxID=243629 RepID=UPI003BACA255